ncbi:MAG: MATE family efflux transporter [Deltaproteobacteria bacterium]|nr:MATE family efflux transporter [Deltaproteobacteria bacterium]
MTTLFDRARTRTILVLAGPIIGGMGSQMILNVVDAAMVGRLGPAAQGAVGLGSITFFVLANLTICLGTGVQAMVSRRDGQDDPEGAGAALDTALVTTLLVALPLGGLLSVLAPHIFPLLSDDATVVAGGSQYMGIRLMALGVVTANYCFRGFWNGIGRSKVYLKTLLVIHTVNLFLNWVLIFGHLGAPAMGVQGAALASALAAAAGTVSYTVLAVANPEVRSRYKPFRFTSLSVSVARRLGSLSWPEALRGMGLMGGYMLFQLIHSHLGTRELAAGTILIQLASVGFLPALGFGLAGATFVGRALGRKDPAEARAMVWQTLRIALVILLVPATVLQLAPGLILSGFTPDQVVIDLAAPALRILSISFVVDAVPFVIIYSLLGAGATRWAAAVQLGAQYLVLIPLAWILGVTLQWGVVGLWLAMAASRVLLAALALRKLRSSGWEEIVV